MAAQWPDARRHSTIAVLLENKAMWAQPETAP